MNAAPPAGSVLPLRLQELSFGVGGKPLLGPLTLTVEGATRTVILGPNGAGKSLLLRLCHGLLPPTSGRLSWADADPQRVRRAQAMVFQRPVLLRRSALANIDYALAARGVARGERRRRARAALEQVGLGAVAGRPARVLSGGEQQRLALARAWALRPQLLFLDEPTASLDPGACRRVEAVIAAIFATGTALLMATHDLGQARRHADRVVFLDRGRVLENGPAEMFFRRPRHPRARAFLAGELLD